MKNYIPLFVMFIFFQSQAQTYKHQFSEAFSKKDTAAQRRLLETWEKENSNDAELYTAYYNYYLSKSHNNLLVLGSNPGGKEAFKLISKDTTNKEEIFLYEEMSYDPELLRKAFNYINKGIEKFPARLDMRFGKIHMLGKLKNYEPFTNDIIAMIHYSDKIKNAWTWTDNKPVNDPQNALLQGVQSYIVQLYDTEDDAQLNNMKKIAETALIYYPDNVECLSDLSIVYMLHNDYEHALEPLLKAEKIKPADAIILNNIAQAYKLKGDKTNAIKYYERAIKHGDAETKGFCEEQIKKLKKK